MSALFGKFAMFFASGSGPSFWMPGKGSTFAGEMDTVFYFIMWLCFIFFAIIVGFMVFFVWRYRRPKGVKAEKSPHHNQALEITWSIIPSILVLVIFYVGFRGYMNLATAPANAYEIQVTGQKWKWLFTYPNGYVDENLHVPINVPVRLITQSEDVIHSLFIPEFRVKDDVVPGRYGQLWFEATVAGEYEIFCAEYCGTSHSEMLAWAIVHPTGEFEIWLEDASNFLDKMPPHEAGALLYKQRGCQQCHSTDGVAGIGPTFKSSWGRERAMRDGSSKKMDENYVRDSILNPQAELVAGFEPVMPTFKGRLKDKEITALIEFLKSLGDQPYSPLPVPEAGEEAPDGDPGAAES